MNKFKYILSIGIIVFIFFEAVFAVRVSPVLKSDPEYQVLIRRFPDVEVITEQLTSGRSKDSVPAVLKVRFNGMPEYATFLSGQSTYPLGGICPLSIFQKDAFEQKAVQLLFEGDYPLEIGKFNHAMLLIGEKEKVDIVGKVSALGRQAANLEEKYIDLQQVKREAEESKDSSEELEKTAKYLKELCAVRQETVGYLMDYIYGVSVWEQLSKFYVGSGSAENAAPSDIASIREGIKIIDSHKSEAAGVIQFIEKDELLSPLSSLYVRSQMMDERQLRPGFFRLFCRYWGKEAEDALIFEILQNLEKYDEIPSTIEIYGNRDSCFQCQVKLQWLADNLASKIQRARERHHLPPIPPQEGKLTIVYYANAQGEYQVPCLVAPDRPSTMGLWKLATRRESEVDQIMRFEFTEGDTASLRIHAFTPLSMRMLVGRYGGNVKSIDSKKRILEVEITGLDVPLIEVDADGLFPLVVERPEELRTFYNRKKVYIGLQQLSMPPLVLGQEIRFEVIDDHRMDNELTKKGGVFGMAVIIPEEK